MSWNFVVNLASQFSYLKFQPPAAHNDVVFRSFPVPAPPTNVSSSLILILKNMLKHLNEKLSSG